VRADPRTHIVRAALAAQHALLMRLSSGVQAAWADFSLWRAACYGREDRPDDTVSEVGKAVKTLVTTLDSIAGDSLKDARQVWDAPPPVWSFVDLNGEFGIELTAQDNADTRHAGRARGGALELRRFGQAGRTVETVRAGGSGAIQPATPASGNQHNRGSAGPERLCAP